MSTSNIDDNLDCNNSNKEAIGNNIELVLAKVADLCQSSNIRVATAESCTGGWVSKALTDRAGSSSWFEAALVVYSNQAKSNLLKVDPEIIARDGAVSKAVVCEMTAGCLAVTGADLAVSISGIAGPGGGTDNKPVGTVWMAWQVAGKSSEAQRFLFSGDRDMVRLKSVQQALLGIIHQLD